MRTFFALVDKLNTAPAPERETVEKVIWGSFGVERAILALDMSNFSLYVRRNGILPYLCKIRRMQQVTEPIVRAVGGEVVKYEADNMMAIFPDCANALTAAVQINQAFLKGAGQTETDRIAVSIGIDFGKFLMIPDEDCFGDAVNRAYKMGEDLAHGGEILITTEVRNRLGEKPPYGFEEERLSVSGMEMVVNRVQYKS